MWATCISHWVAVSLFSGSSLHTLRSLDNTGISGFSLALLAGSNDLETLILSNNQNSGAANIPDLPKLRSM